MGRFFHLGAHLKCAETVTFILLLGVSLACLALEMCLLFNGITWNLSTSQDSSCLAGRPKIFREIFLKV